MKTTGKLISIRAYCHSCRWEAVASAIRTPQVRANVRVAANMHATRKRHRVAVSLLMEYDKRKRPARRAARTRRGTK